MARLFIGIPTYRRADLVGHALRSVLAQSFDDITVVVSDNHSGGDVTPRVAQLVAACGDPRVRFHVQPDNIGEYGQGRYFFAESAGCDLFMILHDDDVLLPGALETGVRCLDAAPEAAFFVANAYGMTPEGVRDAALTAAHLRDQGRVGAVEGLYDVLTGHLACGFAPISGTLFRRAALERSGFVDEDMSGNYPFEANIFLRLGEVGAKAWFCAQELMGVRFHPGALRNQRLLRDPVLIASCVKLWGRRRFTGGLERRRRVLVSRYRRAEAMIRLEAGDYAAARRMLIAALRDNPRSARAWALAPALLAAPGALRAALRLGQAA